MTSPVIEVRSIDRIPPEERYGRVRDQFTFWFSNNANVFNVVLGGVLVLALDLSLVWACAAIVLGVAIGLLFVGFHAVQGPRLGVPQMIQSRAQFGFYGAVFVFAASIVLDFGFLAAQLVLQAESLQLLIKGLSVPAWIVVLAVPVLILAIFGYRWIHVFQRWMTPILAVTFLVVAARAVLRGHPAGAAAVGHTPSFALFMGATALFVMAMVSWAPYVSDYSRYLPAEIDGAKAFRAVVAGIGIPAVFCAVLGAYISALLPHEESTVAAIGQVGGSWVLPIMAASLIGSNVTNSYTGMLALAGIASCFTRVRRSLTTRVVGLVLIIAAGTASALLGYQSFLGNLENFLNVLLYVFLPWSAINLTDYYLVRRGSYDVDAFFTPSGRYGPFAWPGLVAYALAVLVQIPFINQTIYEGAIAEALGGLDISWIVGGVAGMAFYLLAVRTRPGQEASR